ncbi:MAG: response regulator [Bacteroidales bacterium]|nr:response regulator [Bacteroidales bacterium]
MAKLKTLIVDDEPGIRSGIRRILSNFTTSYPFIEENFEYELEEAEDGIIALDKIKIKKYDIILLDNKLPGIEGIEILNIIKKEEIDCAVMMITSFASLDLAVRATNEGAYNFVPKPFTPAELRTAMENITKHLYLKRLTKDVNKEEKQFRFQFLSIIGHELKSPINAVESYLRIILEQQLGNNIDDYKTMILRSIERIKGMRTLISDMLDLTKVQSQNQNLPKSELDICSLAKRIIETLEPMQQQRNIKIYTDFPAECNFYCNENEINIIFNNLISNAIKYNIENGKIFLTIKPEENQIKIITEDTGIGMTKEEVDMLFGEFVRIKNNQTKNIEGSGLGLSILKKIIEKYHGTINVDSTPDKGTTFSIKMFHAEK